MFNFWSERKKLNNKEKSSRSKALWKNPKAILASLLAFVTVAEVAKVGATSFDIEAAYQKTLAEAQKKYEALVATGEAGTSFEGYLVLESIPLPADFEALKKLLNEFEYPVHLYSGSTILQKTMSFIGGVDTGGYYNFSPIPLSIKGHEVFVTVADDTFSNEEVLTIISELSHAVQAESGENPSLIEWAGYGLSQGGYSNAYKTENSFEERAHGTIEPLLFLRYRHLQESPEKRTQEFTEMFERLHIPVPKSFKREDFSFDQFSKMVSTVLLGVNNRQFQFSAFDEVEIVFILEALPGYSAELEYQPDYRTLFLRVAPTQELYESFLSLFAPHEKPSVPLRQLLDKLQESLEKSQLEIHSRYVNERNLFKQASESFATRVSLLLTEQLYKLEFTFEDYEKFMDLLATQQKKMEEFRIEYHNNERDFTTEELNLYANLFQTSLVVNGVGRFTPGVTELYGVFDGVAHKSKEHYEALRKIFNESAQDKK
jgi:hypothetical protein